MIAKKIALVFASALVIGMLLCPPIFTTNNPTYYIPITSASGNESLISQLISLFSSLHLFVYRLGEIDLELEKLFWDAFSPRYRFLIGLGTLAKYIFAFIGIWSLGIVQGLVRYIRPQ